MLEPVLNTILVDSAEESEKKKSTLIFVIVPSNHPKQEIQDENRTWYRF